MFLPSLFLLFAVVFIVVIIANYKNKIFFAKLLKAIKYIFLQVVALYCYWCVVIDKYAVIENAKKTFLFWKKKV